MRISRIKKGLFVKLIEDQKYVISSFIPKILVIASATKYPPGMLIDS